MKKIIALGASNSCNSINQQLAKWTAEQLKDSQVEVLDLNDFELPLYGIDREKEQGIPKLAKDFKNKIESADGIVLSLAEHNGSFASAFKNTVDWISRLEGKIWAGKKMFLMATSPGGRGGVSVFEHAKSIYPHQGASIEASFSLPFFSKNFNNEEGIIDQDLRSKWNSEIALFEAALLKEIADLN